MTLRLLNLEPEGYSEKALEILKGFSDVDEGPLTREELLDCISQYDAVIVRLGHKIDETVLDAAKRLNVIASATTGLNHIDCTYAKIHGIDIISLRNETEFLDTIHATAEHTWALILSLIRNVPTAVQHVNNHGWSRDIFKGSELYGKTLGVIGYGRLGKKVAGYGVAFGMEVLATDVRPVRVESGVDLVPLNELLSRADIVTIHVPYDTTTHAFLGEGEIKVMKSGSYLINTSRGEVLNESALLESLRGSHLAGAALDVMSGENIGDLNWLQNDPLIQYAKHHRKLLITPHLGGCTCESMEKTEVFIAQKLKSYFEERL